MVQGAKVKKSSGKPSHQQRKSSKNKKLYIVVIEPKQKKSDTYKAKSNINMTKVRKSA